MKLWKIKNKLFGWDYIYWEEGIVYSGVARVYVDGKGRPYYWKYGSKYMSIIYNHNDVSWLTCHPSKYFPVLARTTYETVETKK